MSEMGFGSRDSAVVRAEGESRLQKVMESLVADLENSPDDKTSNTVAVVQTHREIRHTFE